MDNIYSVILCILIVAILLLYHALINRMSTKANFPPGPRPLPLIGNLHILNLKRPYLTLTELSKKYGTIFTVQMATKKIVVLTGYETVKDALVNQADEFGERAALPIFKAIDNGKGVILSHGENWKVMRRFTITTLRDFGMGKSIIEEKIIDECDKLVQEFQSFKGKPFDNSVIVNAAVANIIVSIAIGHRMEYGDPTFLRLLRLTNENIRIMGSPIITLYNLFPNILDLFPGSHKKILENIKEIHAFIRKIFVEHIKELDVNHQKSFIDTFLIRQKEEENKDNNHQNLFDDLNLVSLVRNLFTAGMETTTTTIRWGLLLMVKHTDVQAKVQEEIARVIGCSTPKYDHRLEMPYTTAVIHEIQRFANILPMNFPHETSKDVNFKGYFLPKGTQVVPLLYSVLRDSTRFAEPEKFNPNHFLDSKGNFLKNEAFMPFSAGRRVCAGENLAKMELFLFFTFLLQRFHFHLPPGVTDINLQAEIGLVTPPKSYNICAVPQF